MADRKPPQKGAAAADKLPAGPIGEAFMERTRYEYLDVSDQRRGLPQPPLELEADPSAARLALPDPAGVHVRAVDVRTAIEQRISVRRYAEVPLTLAELSYLLWCTQGVKRVEGGYVTMRTVPSAGARHALETYLLINRVEGVAPGLYRYLAVEHELLPVQSGADVADLVTGACWGQQFVRTSAVTFVWTAVAYRMTWRYGQRGYRYMHLDAGHVCQNLYLAAAPIDCGVCAIAAFSDEDMSRVLDIDGVQQFAIYVAVVGKKP